MRVISDLHIHSPYSRATSKDMTFKALERGALAKGLHLLGTGDFTHPKWRAAIKEELEEEGGFYRLRGGGKTLFAVTGEVCTNFEFGGRGRRIHHLIMLPSLEVAEQLCESLSGHGNLASDGRPNLAMSGTDLAEAVVDLGEDCLIVPAHIWTPWFSLYGAHGGVDSMRECYGEYAPHIYAAETGLSSDPPMNWRVSELDQVTLLSNSDSHSAHPWRIGREANIMEMKEPTYAEMVDTIKFHKGRVTTIEVDPAYGKYHWTGHRDCGVSVPPRRAVMMKGVCPVCGRGMTKGVAERVEELADREEGAVPAGAQKFIRILPLCELIATVACKDVFAAEVQRRYWSMLKHFGNEYEVLMDTPPEKLEEVCGAEVARLVIASREGRLEISPGYDGVYGTPKGCAAGGGGDAQDRPESPEERFLRRGTNLEDYINDGR